MAGRRKAIVRAFRPMGVWLVCLIVLAPLPGRADDDAPPPGTPADVVAITNRMKSGVPPSAADIQRLREWAQQMVARSGMIAATTDSQGNATAAPEGIPARVTVSMHYTMKSELSSGTYDVEGSADALLFASINGNGDYLKNMLDTSVGVSMFRFEPLKEGGIASGSEHRFEAGPRGTWDFKGHYTKTEFGLKLVTTGTDLLFASSGGFGGMESGHVHNTWHSTSNPTSDADFRDESGSCPIDIPFADEGRYHRNTDLMEKYKAGTTSPVPAMNLSYAKLVEAIQSNGSKPVTAHETFDFVVNGDRFTGSSSVSIVLRPKPLELVIEPSDETAYQDWLPLPDLKDGGDKEIFGDPKPLSIHVALVKPGGAAATGAGPTKPDADVGGKIEIFLQDVSELTGVAMNYPSQGKGDTRPDLFFLPQADQPPGIMIDVNDPGHAYTVENAVEATVLVGARDTGAFGQITARIESLGIVSVSRRNGKSDPDLALPLDDNKNHIADKWERDEGIFEKNLRPDWDEEDQPSNMMTKGDNISLFDQYRGFVVAKHDSEGEYHQRISPKQRTLFYYAAGGDRANYRKGAELYKTATGGIAVYDFQAPRRMAPAPSDGDASQIFPRWVNFQTTPYSSKMAYAVWIDDFDRDWDEATAKQHPDGVDKLGRSRRGSTLFGNTAVDTAVTLGTLPDDSYHGNHMSPKTTARINISRAAWRKWIEILPTSAFGNDDFKAAAAALHLNLDTLGAMLKADPQHTKLIDRIVADATMHELGHATGAVHHNPDFEGDEECPMRYWQEGKPDEKALLAYLSSAWDLTTAYNGAVWKFCDEDQQHLTLKP